MENTDKVMGSSETPSAARDTLSLLCKHEATLKLQKRQVELKEGQRIQIR